MADNTTFQNSNSILNAFKNKFATKVNSIYVNSLKREVNFREVSVTEQKSLSKTMIENESRRDIVYDTQCALINRLCLENDDKKLREDAKEAAHIALPDAAAAEGIDMSTSKGASFAMKFTNDFIQKYIAEHSFDIYSLTEFDRIRILMEIYQNNYFKDEIVYKCKECGTENRYPFDFSKIIDRFNEFDLTDQTYTIEDNRYVYNFILNYPSVRSVSQFYKMYVKKYKGASAKEKDVLDNLENDTKKVKEEAREAARVAMPAAMEAEGIEMGTPQAATFAVKFTNDFIQKYVSEHGFDVYTLTEFDRIRILMEIYQNNYFKDEITYKCKECGAENKYTLDFSKIIDRFNEFDLTDQTYTLEDKQYVYNFVLNYPSVKNVSQFYKMYVKKYKGVSAKEKDVLDNLENVDYINLYIKQIELIDKEKGTKDIADLSLMSYSDIESLIEVFPQNIIFSEDTGVLRYIAKNFIEKINSVFQYEKCAQCGAEAPAGLGSVADFL